MVVIADQLVTLRALDLHGRRSRGPSAKAATMRRAAIDAARSCPACMPVTWNIGSAESTTDSPRSPRQ